jgi:hypothetical protein
MAELATRTSDLLDGNAQPIRDFVIRPVRIGEIVATDHHEACPLRRELAAERTSRRPSSTSRLQRHMTATKLQVAASSSPLAMRQRVRPAIATMRPRYSTRAESAVMARRGLGPARASR